MNASLEMRYTSPLGVSVGMAVEVPDGMTAGGDGAHLSPGEALDVIDRAGRIALPRLAVMAGAMLEQAHEAVRAAGVESLRRHMRDNAARPDTDLAPAGRGEG